MSEMKDSIFLLGTTFIKKKHLKAQGHIIFVRFCLWKFEGFGKPQRPWKL